jgi:hypothetical protein
LHPSTERVSKPSSCVLEEIMEEENNLALNNICEVCKGLLSNSKAGEAEAEIRKSESVNNTKNGETILKCRIL